jgi:hypothetical protein
MNNAQKSLSEVPKPYSLLLLNLFAIGQLFQRSLGSDIQDEL